MLLSIFLSLAFAQSDLHGDVYQRYASRLFATATACQAERSRLVARFEELGRPVSESACSAQDPRFGTGAYVQLLYRES